MSQGGDSLVERLFERLLDAVGGSAPESPITIGDIYQRLIPYRTVRSEIGVMELATYEHGLLRLLGGEGGYLQVEGETAADEIRRELESPNPILGIYRDYAEVRVRFVNPPGSSPGDADASPPAVSTPPPRSAPATATPDPTPWEVGALPSEASAAEFSPASTSEPPRGLGQEAPRPRERVVAYTTESNMAHGSEASDSPSTRDAPASATCSGCDNRFPAVPGVRFCPYCGHIREPFPCGRCGTRLDPEWNYCIRCGAPAGA